jgi:hypothetical protein
MKIWLLVAPHQNPYYIACMSVSSIATSVAKIERAAAAAALLTLDLLLRPART